MTDGILLLWYVLTALSLAFMAWDLWTNTPAMGVMKAAWLLIALYLGPIGLFVYLLSCRQPLPGTHDAFIAAHWKQSVGSLAHCLAGDATGIILAAIVTYNLGLPNGLDLIVEYTAAFLFGWAIFQALFMKSMLGGNYVRALQKTFFAEFVSMNMVMVGMIPTMVILMMRIPGARDPLGPRFWGVMSVATLVGGLFAYPINSWMVARGIKHGMMSAPEPAAAPRAELPPSMPATTMPGMHGVMLHEMSTDLTASRQAGVIAGTLAALAAAVWLTTQLVQIRL